MIEYLIIITALYLISLGVLWWGKNKEIEILESNLEKAFDRESALCRAITRLNTENIHLVSNLEKYKPLRDEKGRFKKKEN